MTQGKIKMWQLALLMLTITPITKFILLPTAMSKTLQQDSYILIICYILLDVLALLCILHCYKKSPNTTFYQILEGSVGKVLAKIIIALYLAFFFFKTLAPIIEQKRMIAGNLYETIPRVSTLIPMFILAGYISYKGAYALGRNANILGFVSFFSVTIILLLSIGSVQFSNLLPIFNRPATDLLESFQITLMWFGDFTIILMMLGKISQNREKKSTKSLVVAYLISQALILLFYILLISIFGEITEKQTNAIAKLSKYNTALSNLGRFDWIPIILLMLCLMMATVSTFYCSSECVGLLIKKPSRLVQIIALTLLYCIVALLLQDNLKSLYAFFIQYFNYLAVVLQYIIPLLLPLLYKIYKRRQCKKHEKIQAREY